MEEQRSGPKRRVEKNILKGLMPLIIIIIILLAASLYFLLLRSGNDPDNDRYSVETGKTQAAGNEAANQTSAPRDSGDSPVGTIESLESGTVSPSSEAGHTDSSNTATAEASGTNLEAASQREIDPVLKEKADSITSFFKRLDSRDYIMAFNLGEESIVYFPALIQRLADNPPVVTGETDDLFTILQNTAHFFRIIGKKNILILKGILDREKDTFEQTLADFYELTRNPHYLEQRLNISLTPDSMYLYSGFFLNTMGGRLYLFRRDSMSRMVVSFYAIQNIENANRLGKNRYGIEIKPAVDSLIDEFESSKINLKMRDHYLDTLYDLKEKYQ